MTSDLDLLGDDFAAAAAEFRDPDAALLTVELLAAPLLLWFAEHPGGLRLHRREPCDQRHLELVDAAGTLATTWANSLPATLRATLGSRGGVHLLVCVRDDELALAASDGVRLVELARRVVEPVVH